MSDLAYAELGENLERLRATMTTRPLGLIGAGASVAAGYPTWTGLLGALEAEILKSAATRAITPKTKVILDALGDPAWHAEELALRLEPELFHNFLTQTFGIKKTASAAHKALARLPFRHFLTTNYDQCMEVALRDALRPYKVVRWNESKDVASLFSALTNPDADTHLVYLHGRYDKPESIVLTESSYRVYLEEIFERRLIALFMTQPVVFIGFSMTDPELGHLMRVVRATTGGEASNHFGVFGYRTLDERDLIHRRMLGKYGVRAIFYPIVSGEANTDDHHLLLDVLQYLEIGKTSDRATSTKKRNLAEAPPLSQGLSFASSSGDAPLWALDPHKGKFGGAAESDGRRLSVENVRTVVEGAILSFELVVRATRGAPPLKGTVRFRLHPTFDDDNYMETVKRGVARSAIPAAQGAFTVGVVADRGKTKLELDLSELDDFPTWFRER